MEALRQSYPESQVRFFALDFWNGSDAQADLFQNVSGIGFPVLLNASGIGAPDMYNCSYHYCFVIDGDGLVQYRGLINIPAIEIVMQQAVDRLPTGVGVGDTPGAVANLEAAYPNPFNPQTTIPFEIAPEGAGLPLSLEVLDVRGRVVRTLVAGAREAGRHQVVFDGRNERGDRLPSGVYLTRLRVGNEEQTRLLSLIK